MKTGVVVTSCLLLLLLAVCPFYQQTIIKERERLLADTDFGYYIPSELSGPAALEFKGIISNFLFLKLSTFFGGKIIAKKGLTPDHAEQIFKAADIITDLDPWFWDAYLMSDMILAWDFKRTDLANRLLHKAINHRTWDYSPFYYLGFNYFYFLKDNKNGSKYLMEASKRSGCPDYVPSLASRLSVYENDIQPAIIFLDEQIRSTQNPELKKRFKVRMETLLILKFLENKVAEFGKQMGYPPEKITDLVTEGIVGEIPKDPYGGEFFLTGNGRVFTTSEMRFLSTDKQKAR